MIGFPYIMPDNSFSYQKVRTRTPSTLIYNYRTLETNNINSSKFTFFNSSICQLLLNYNYSSSSLILKTNSSNQEIQECVFSANTSEYLVVIHEQNPLAFNLLYVQNTTIARNINMNLTTNIRIIKAFVRDNLFYCVSKD